MRTYIYHIILSAIIFLTVESSVAQDGTAYNYLNIPTSSHVYALGGINITAIDDDVNLYEQNPALMGAEVESQLAVSYMRYLGNSNFMSARYARAAGEHGAWSAGITYYGYGEMQGMDQAGVATGTFNVSDMAFSGMYSHDLSEKWRGGISLKFLYSNYEQYSAFAIATDLGVNYYDPDKNFSMSATVANLGGQVKRFNEHYDRLPIDVRLGFTKGINNGPFSLSVTAYGLTKWHLPYYKRIDDNDPTSGLEIKDKFGSNLFRHLIFGLEYAPSDKFYIAAGYNHRTKTDMSTFARSFVSGFSLGAGIRSSKFKIGAAMAQPHTGGFTFMFNLATNLYEF
ncbi:MAG: type IX secretion system protein PorQ [Candidatus Limisoma sp.]|nr:type IX secretion system protein PorQ [Candidatus Limisoma sp.]